MGKYLVGLDGGTTGCKTCIFDLEGNYIKTIDIGYRFQDFCIDEENNRIVMAMNDDIQFAYWDIKDNI
jgi:sugar (pentulose or hexulose) kinase